MRSDAELACSGNHWACMSKHGNLPEQAQCPAARELGVVDADRGSTALLLQLDRNQISVEI